jgi:Flp pilus assembly protein TadD
VKKRLPRPRALPILTILGSLVAAGALLSIIAMTAAAAAVPQNLPAALEKQRRLAAERPQDAAAFNDLGNLLVMAGQPAEAESAYRHAVEIDPHRLSPLYNLGLLLLQEGKSAEARQLFEKVLEIEPRHAWAHYQLGALFERKGDKPRAVREYAQAFRLDPQLAFREVNPQIVENGVVTESLLLAYRRQSTASEAPPIYDERSRIRELLVQEPGKDDAVARTTAPPPAAPPPAQGAPGARANVLRPRDLSGSSSLGQATPPGSRPGTGPPVAGRPAVGYGAPSYAPQENVNGGYQGGARQWTRPAPNPPNADGTQPGTVVTPPPVGLYYRPSPSSTGRLGTQVMPEQNG